MKFGINFVLVVCLALCGCKQKPNDDGQPVSMATFDSKNVKCISHKEYWITTSTGPCDDYIPTSQIQIGDNFFADGKQRTIQVIRRFFIEKDWQYNGQKFQAGYYCTAGESIADLDSSLNQDRLWLYIDQCNVE